MKNPWLKPQYPHPIFPTSVKEIGFISSANPNILILVTDWLHNPVWYLNVFQYCGNQWTLLQLDLGRGSACLHIRATFFGLEMSSEFFTCSSLWPLGHSDLHLKNHDLKQCWILFRTFLVLDLVDQTLSTNAFSPL